MRVIGGKYRSRRLKSLPGLETRPTPDRLRESLFNILASKIAGSVFLDTYAGTGAVGIEALSRGASRVIFIERARAAAATIRENLDALGIREGFEVLQGRALQYLPHRRADIVFLDPPYALAEEYEGAMKLLGDLAPPLMIVQHHSRNGLTESLGKLSRIRILRQGDNSLSFYEPSPS